MSPSKRTDEPVSLDEMRDEMRARLRYLEEQIAPLQREADEIRRLLGEPRTQGARDALLDAVRSMPGRPGSDYAGLINLDAQQARRLLNELEEEGAVRREGNRRGTRWFPGQS